MDANKIKFVDDDGEVMTARVHTETHNSPEGINSPEEPDLEGIQEEIKDHLLKDEVVDSSSAEEQVNETVKNEVEKAASSVEEAVEQHIKEIEDNVLQAAPDVIKMDEVKVPEQIDKENLSLVANAVNDVRVDERVPPKGCCILQ